MLIDCICTSCNNNSTFLPFIKPFIKSWTKLFPNIILKIIFINDKIPPYLSKFSKYLILFKPPNKMHTSFISQHIRLLYPALLKGNILITDIDLFPLNRQYFINNIKKYDNNMFICFNQICGQKHDELPMAYNIANAKTWSEIFNIQSLNDIYNYLHFHYNKIQYNLNNGNGWNSDQKNLFTYITKWDKKNKRFLCLNDNNTHFCRLDRNYFNPTDFNHDFQKKIKFGLYTDYHALRPYQDHKHITDTIIHLTNPSIHIQKINSNKILLQQNEIFLFSYYGCGASWADVTTITNKLIPHKSIHVHNKTFNCDPVFGKSKNLIIITTSFKSYSAKEHETLLILSSYE